MIKIIENTIDTTELYKKLNKLNKEKDDIYFSINYNKLYLLTTSIINGEHIKEVPADANLEKLKEIKERLQKFENDLNIFSSEHNIIEVDISFENFNNPNDTILVQEKDYHFAVINNWCKGMAESIKEVENKIKEKNIMKNTEEIVKSKQKRLSKEEKDYILSEVFKQIKTKEGINVKVFAVKFNVTTTAIYKFLKKNNIRI